MKLAFKSAEISPRVVGGPHLTVGSLRRATANALKRFAENYHLPPTVDWVN